MNKDLIQNRFAKNLETYNKNASIQKEMALKLCSMLNKKDFYNILEIGCGTGLLTKQLIKQCNFKKYTAIDIVQECNQYISNISTNIDFISDDIEHYIDISNSKYDLIISNATFQWLEDIENFLTIILHKLNKKGILLFSTFGTQNFVEISQITGISLDYKPTSFYKTFFHNYNNCVIEDKYRLKFETPKEVLTHIKQTGVNAIQEKLWTKKDLKNFQNKYNKDCSLTYNPIYVKIENL